MHILLLPQDIFPEVELIWSKVLHIVKARFPSRDDPIFASTLVQKVPVPIPCQHIIWYIITFNLLGGKQYLITVFTYLDNG